MMPKPLARGARLEGSRWTPYLFVAPVAVYLLLFQGYPLLQELMLGFPSTSLLSPADHTFVGVRNYVELVGTDDFRHALLITTVYTVACVVLSIGFGLVAALLLNSPFRGRGVARAMVTIPWAAPPVAVALIFTWMYNAQYGIFNRSLRRFDLIWLMTQGGPIGATNTLVIELYRRAFVYRDLGQAAAVGMVGLSIAIIVTMVYFRLTLRTERAKGQR